MHNWFVQLIKIGFVPKAARLLMSERTSFAMHERLGFTRRAVGVAALVLQASVLVGCGAVAESASLQTLGHDLYLEQPIAPQATTTTIDALSRIESAPVTVAAETTTTQASTTSTAHIESTTLLAVSFDELSTQQKGEAITNNANAELAAYFAEWDASRGLEQIAPSWEFLYDERTTQSKEGRSYGLTDSAPSKVRMYVYTTPATDNPQDLGFYTSVTLHELAHVIDLSHLSDEQRTAFAAERGYTNRGYVWLPENGTSDFSSGAGDFAETFSECIQPDGLFRSELVSTVDAGDCDMIRTFVEPVLVAN